MFLRTCFGWRNFVPRFKSAANRKMSLMGDVRQDCPVYEVRFKSCGNLYKRWEKEKKYRKLPTGDLDFKVSYVDTRKDDNEHSVPTVVALHGAPGSFEDFSPLTSHLHQNGIRVVVPNFPDFSVFEPGVFRHSDEEKAQFVKDFLKALSIKQVDTLIVHSGSVYPGLLLCVHNKPVIRSLIMLNPGTHTYDMPGTKNINVLRLLVVASEVSIIYKVLQVFGPTVLQILRIPVRVDNFLDPLLSATVMVHGNVLEAKDKLLQLLKKGLPMLYAFSDDDKLMGKEPSHSFARLLGLCESDICTYDTNGEIKQIGKETAKLKVICFENGSHYVFRKYPYIINSEISKFMSKL